MKKTLKRRLNLMRVALRNLDELSAVAGGGNGNTVGDCHTTQCFSGSGGGSAIGTSDCSLWLA